MSTADLELTAHAIVANGKGILAADETPGTLTRRFNAHGIASTPDSRRAYRELFFTTSGIAEFIGGVILHDETIRHGILFGRDLDLARSGHDGPRHAIGEPLSILQRQGGRCATQSGGQTEHDELQRAKRHDAMPDRAVVCGKAKIRAAETAQSVSSLSRFPRQGVPAAHGEKAGRIIRPAPTTSAGSFKRVPAPSPQLTAGWRCPIISTHAGGGASARSP